MRGRVNLENLAEYSFPCGTGKVLSTQKFFNGNVLGATAQMLFLVNPASVPDVLEYEEGLRSLELGSGKFSRALSPPTNTSVDDYLALACHPFFARRIYRAAITNFGFLNLGSKFRLDSFMFRFQGFWQHLKLCAGVKIWPLGRLIWAAHIFFAARKPDSDQDGHIQASLMCLAYIQSEPQYQIMEAAVQYYAKKAKTPTWKIVANYIGDPDHPLVKCWGGPK